MWFNIDFSNVSSADRNTVVTSTRTYVGPHIFTDGALEYSSFEGGYIDPAKGVMYYITDWQGNDAAVIDKSGDIVQSTTYYPYGEPTIEPRGQRFLFGGKEREHAAGRNSYDFGARNLAANAWTTPDPLAEKFYPISPYAYCGGDPINRVDLAPFQPKGQKGQDGVKTITIQHYNDCIALPVDMPNAENHVTRKDVPTMIFNLFKEHSITTFIDDINNWGLYLENYKNN